ncbi:MAG: flavodoxin [Muribaculaceae bacterium]|nr:flavodoxin [Muribaculaceae bacterium]
MKRLILFIGVAAAACCLLATSCTGKKKDGASDAADNGKAIVCYFSATGTTEKAAQRIAELIGAPLHNIEPMDLYTDSDLNWRDSLSRSSVEMRDRSSRPALKDSLTDLSGYSIVFIGYPNWWNTHPTLINTFIEANDLQGKTIVPFMTSGGSNITNSEKELSEQYPTLTFAKGLLMNDVTDDDIRAWTKELGL